MTAELRKKVAEAKGLHPSLADRLQGDTEEALTADADALLAAVGEARTPTTGGAFLSKAFRERR